MIARMIDKKTRTVGAVIKSEVLLESIAIALRHFKCAKQSNEEKSRYINDLRDALIELRHLLFIGALTPLICKSQCVAIVLMRLEFPCGLDRPCEGVGRAVFFVEPCWPQMPPKKGW